MANLYIVFALKVLQCTLLCRSVETIHTYANAYLRKAKLLKEINGLVLLSSSHYSIAKILQEVIRSTRSSKPGAYHVNVIKIK